ncbi:MAG: carbohydrate ABC transporter substrate-binding protein [Actinobacteria bacterium]|nr:carbohydrate ABC transporter substrate-binding protein [Actinomycetota bacterium]
MSNEVKENGVSRRTVLKGAAVGGAGLLGGGTLLSSCGSDEATGPVKFTARTNDETGLKIAQALADAYTAETGIEVTMQGSGDTNAFQDGISQYLQGTPDDAFQWMAGFRTNFRADQGLLVDLSENISNLGDQMPAGFVSGATNPTDGKQYIIPTTWYPWGLHYRKSTMQEIGLDPEGLYNWDDFMKLLEGTKKKGLIGYALGDKGGWEAMGTFSILNVRLNGYNYHIDLLNGRAKWTDQKTVDVFKQFEMLIPYMNKNVLDISWDGMRDLLLQKKCGAIMMGDSIDAPVDGMCAATNGTNPEGGAAFAEWCGSEAGMLAAQAAGDTSLYANSRLDSSGYDAFNKQKLAVIGEAKNVMNFLDRDCRNDFAGPIVGVQIQNFLKNPADLNKILEETQAAWDALPPLA